ncbi:hypothetical protein ACFU5O_10775 [Streptomyces sp. NPDC057445]|uniref:hypothetical protein n=1 Tax=Streptomyces sp. NPDC057445 TaxID=3346136 RepID=UPI003695D23D
MNAPVVQDEQRTPSSTADTWPAVLLLPALLLLRFLGEHAWAYWTAVVIGVLGVIAAAVEISGAVGHLLKGRRPWVAVWVLFVLLTAVLVLVLRLAEHW